MNNPISGNFPANLPEETINPIVIESTLRTFGSTNTNVIVLVDKNNNIIEISEVTSQSSTTVLDNTTVITGLTGVLYAYDPDDTGSSVLRTIPISYDFGGGALIVNTITTHFIHDVLLSSHLTVSGDCQLNANLTLTRLTVSPVVVNIPDPVTNNWNPGTQYLTFIYSNAAATITGQVAGIDGETHEYYNNGSYPITFIILSPDSDPVNIYVSSQNIIIYPGEVLRTVYSVNTGNVWYAYKILTSPSIVSLSSNNDVTNATSTLVPLNDLTLIVRPATKNVGTVKLKVNNTVPGEGIKLDFNGGNVNVTSFWAAVTVNGVTVFSTSLSGLLTVPTLASGENLVTVDYSFSTFTDGSGNGNIIIQVAPNSHSSGTLTVEAGSFLTVSSPVN